MEDEASNRVRAVHFLQLAAAGHVSEAYEKYVAADFVHHNPWFKSDRESLREAMAGSARTEPNKSFEVKQVIADGELVAVHSRLERVDAGKVYAVVHIARFAGGRIVELWDIAQEAPVESPNTLGMF